MEHNKLRFALIGNIYQGKKSASIQQVLSSISRYEAELYVDMEYYYFLKDNQRLDIKAAKLFTDDNFEADFVISMGGDGTFLKAASRVGAKSIPILGVNMGRLGFLADISPDQFAPTLDALYHDDYYLESRALIQVETDGAPLGTCRFALNDVAILKRDTASMISIRTVVNGEHLVTYQADGLIVSTPTGSTAYSLSNGGPIIVPQTGTLCLTAVAPHSLNIRPIVLKDDSRIELTVESRSHQFLIAVDGRSEKCAEGTRLTISRAPYGISIVRRRGQSYFATLREKMSWGLDTR